MSGTREAGHVLEEGAAGKSRTVVLVIEREVGVRLLQMPQLCHNFKESRIRKACMAIAMQLCLFILVQMLGVPVTLLNSHEVADIQTASVLEGFSIPSSLPQLTSSLKMDTAADGQPAIHMPILVSVLFHPPVLQFHFLASHYNDASSSRETGYASLYCA
jgi:hypothetical protein